MSILSPRKLGHTDLMVSPLCIGAWQLGGPVTFYGKADGHPDPGKANVLRMIAELHDSGINFIDTAEGYSAGESERRVGEAIRGRRDEWVISTKFGYRVGPDQTRDDSSAPDTILRSLEGSLKRLQTDCVDLFLYHCPPSGLEELDEAKAILEAAKKSGKLRYYGISTNQLDLIQAMHERAMLDVLQFDTSLIHPEEGIRRFVAEHGIGTQLRGVMANGRLSGKYFQAQPVWGEDDNRSYYHKHRDFTLYAPLQEQLPEGYSMGQCAIRLLLDEPSHHSICMGAKTIEDYRSAIEAISLPSIPPALGLAIQEKALAIASLADA